MSGCLNNSILITGKVQNALNGDPVSNAKVGIQGGDYFVTTNKKGTFVLKIPRDNPLKIEVDKFEAWHYLKPGTPPLFLVVEKELFQPLIYPVAEKIDGLAIGIIPEATSIEPDFLSSGYLPSTRPIAGEVEWEKIIDGVKSFHEKRLEQLRPLRERYWNRDTSSREAYSASVQLNRGKFRKIVGAVDEREPVSLTKASKLTETNSYIVSEIQWAVLQEVKPRPALQEWPELDVPHKIFGEGLLLEPKGEPKGFMIAIPDADQEPETIAGLKEGIEAGSQFARRLVENGYTVAIPVIIDRSNRWSRGTNRTSRSWIYAQGYELGRTVTGYEIQKIEALIDWFEEQKKPDQKIGIAGYGEGGLLALYTAALDIRVDATLVSGYFAPREEIWKEPIYRNVWGLLTEFGDAEIASLIAPRPLVIEYSEVPRYDGEKNSGKKIDPPAELWTHSFSDVAAEFDRISSLTGENIGKRALLKEGVANPLPFGSEEGVNALLGFMGNNSPQPLSREIPAGSREKTNHEERMGRMVEQMVGHTQLLLRDSEYVRNEFAEEEANQNQEELRNFYREEMTGWTHHDFLPINPRTKKVEDQPGYAVYEVLIDVLPGIEMWGVLLIPKNIQPNEKRPAIVLQHGRGGDPYKSLVETSTYYGISRRLADKGFVVFSPFGNWTGEERFRWIDRIARPAKNTIWSTVGRQHQQLIRWFQTLPFIDTDRVGLYGKSIGGQAASIIASMLPEYAISINCAYFNEGARKISSVYFPTSFVFHVDSEMPMWNRAHMMEHAEIVNMLIFPRPFMVEHGKKDGIAPPGWVEHEYSKVHEHYSKQGKNNLTEIDLHEGGHIINGVKTIPFLKKHLKWE